MPALLTGRVIALSGSHPGYKHADLNGMIEKNGGEVAAKVTDVCTHLITTQKDFTNKTIKVTQAAEIPTIQVVSLDWLLDSTREGQALDETRYLFTKSNADKSVSTRSTNGKKRARAATPEDAVALTEAVPASDEDRKPPAKKKKDGQEAKLPSAPHVPVDEGCKLASSHSVYIDPEGTIYDASLNQTNVGHNNNKFYRIQLLYSEKGNEYQTWTRWGRVGEHGQSALSGSGSLLAAKSYFEKKFRDKSGLPWDRRLEPPKPGKYTFIERNYEESGDEEEDEQGPSTAKDRTGPKATTNSEPESKPVESTLPVELQRLMALIFNQDYFSSAMMEMSYDANKLPLGKLSKRTLTAGFQKLKDLAEVIANPSIASERHGITTIEAIATLTNAYYTVIPHSFGRNRPPMISNEITLKKEIDLLESLSDMEIANEIMKVAKMPDGQNVHPYDRHYAGLKMREMTPLESSSNEFKELQEYLIKSHGHTHSLRFKVQDIFRIERDGEQDRFAQSPYSKVQNSNRKLLWHGSRCTNFGGILSQGLRIAPPEAPVNGYMFGKGVYLADMSSKSANYCVPYTSGNVGLLLLCEAELGDPMLELQDAASSAAELAKERGCIATWGQGLTAPRRWKDASCVNEDLKGAMMPDTSEEPGPTGLPNVWLQYNEYIAYDVAQIRLRYLFRVEMK